MQTVTAKCQTIPISKQEECDEIFVIVTSNAITGKVNKLLYVVCIHGSTKKS